MVTAASVLRLARCVRSGPIVPAMGELPRMVWQPAHDSLPMRVAPAVASAPVGFRAGSRWLANHTSKSFTGCTMSSMRMRACWVPQYSAHCPI